MSTYKELVERAAKAWDVWPTVAEKRLADAGVPELWAGRDALTAALREARAMVETWASYAPEWATEKHNLAADLAQLDAVLELVERP